jgi:ubiquinone/menaquinone biosynthesis C-methylase UbiE
VHLHSQLKDSVAKSGLEGKYEILGIGAEDVLGRIKAGSVDTVLCCKVLCGIPEPERVLKELYTLLKPGGVVLVFEHVVNRESTLTRMWQGLCGNGKMEGHVLMVGRCVAARVAVFISGV